VIRSWLAVTPFRRDLDCCDLWFSIGPARVAGVLVGVDFRFGDRGVMVDMPRRVDLALAIQECDCAAAEHED
jgi:hypothetical protein